jgi:hypothetical protein
MILPLIFLPGHFALAQPTPFAECGQIWSDSGCIILDVDGMHEDYFLLDTGAWIQSGDWVCVFGVENPGCDTFCLNATACVSVDSIFPQNDPDTTYFNGCGILQEGPNCLLFSPAIGPWECDTFCLVLENYEEFTVGDTVCVYGILKAEPVPECPEASGIVMNNSITRWSSPPTPFNECGVLKLVSGCILFEPFEEPLSYFNLDFYGEFNIGDSVCVTGILITGCDSGCVDAEGCITANNIYSWNQPGAPYDGCGFLIHNGECMTFKPLNEDIYLAMDFYGGYDAYDTVCVSGVIDTTCDVGCTGVDGCLINGNITSRLEFYHEFEVIIKLERGYLIDSVIFGYQGTIIDYDSVGNVYLVQFPGAYIIEQIIDTISTYPGIVFIQPNYTMGLPEIFLGSQSFPDDQQPSYQYGVSPPNYFGENNPYSINVDTAHIYSRGENIVVAVLDNGVDFSHPLLEGSFADQGYDFIDDDNDPSEMEGELYGHGTFVCGIIKRVAPDCKLLPIRVFDHMGYSDSYIVADAIYYAITRSVDVINMSFGNYSSNPIVQDAINYAVNSGIALVAAAGNNNINFPTYPAAFPGVIAVSAVDSTEYRAYFSNFGDYIDVCAPGVDIYSSLAGLYHWGTWSGTSFAAPMATGICALILTDKPDLSSFEMEQFIQFSAEHHLLWGDIIPPNDEFGYGRIDALYAAFNAGLGDVDDSQDIDILDITYLINAIYKNGPQPVPDYFIGDANCSGKINLLDITCLIQLLYKGGPTPFCPVE